MTKASPDFRAGSFIASYLCGPDNERDCRAFTHITAAGDGRLWPGRTPAERYDWSRMSLGFAHPVLSAGEGCDSIQQHRPALVDAAAVGS